jgi:uncharacterized membrane protein
MKLDPTVLLTILGMAAVTYTTRASGLLLMRRVTLSGRLEAWLSAIPGGVLVSIVAPTILATGLPEFLAAIVTVLVAIRTGNLLFAMLAGVVAVWGLRLLL